MNKYEIDVKVVKKGDSNKVEWMAEVTAFDKSTAKIKVFDKLSDNGYRVLSLSEPAYIGEA